MRAHGPSAMMGGMSAVTRAVQVAGPGKQLELVEREVPTPGRGEVLVRVEACGVCHSDSLTVEGGMPGIEYPRVPGHEIAGTVEEIGGSVTRGPRDSASASAGSAATAATATRAGAAT